jgi:hypothetical protein
MGQRAVAIAVVVGVVLGTLLLGLAMALYPGGTWCDRAVHGHAFWGNFLCDLAWDVSLGGDSNPVGSVVAKGAMICLALAVALFFLLVPALFEREAPRRRTARAVRALGSVAVVGMIGVAVLPSSEVGDLHGALVFASAAPALLAALVTVFALFRGEPRPRVAAVLGSLALAASMLDLAMYGWHFAHRADCAPLLPAVQKLALGFLLGWMLVVSTKILALSRSAA